MKRCPKCQIDKPFFEFNRRSSSRDGLQRWCRSCQATYAKPYRKANKDRRTQKNREWRAANPDKRLAHSKNAKSYRQQYYKNNKKLVLQKGRSYQEANKNKVTAYKNKWSRENGTGHRGRCKRFGVVYTRVNRLKIFERDKWVCQLCGEPVDNAISWPDPVSPSLDHIIPLSLGPDVCPGHVEENCQLAHFACNLLKRASYNELDELDEELVGEV